MYTSLENVNIPSPLEAVHLYIFRGPVYLYGGHTMWYGTRAARRIENSEEVVVLDVSGSVGMTPSMTRLTIGVEKRIVQLCIESSCAPCDLFF